MDSSDSSTDSEAAAAKSAKESKLAASRAKAHETRQATLADDAAALADDALRKAAERERAATVDALRPGAVGKFTLAVLVLIAASVAMLVTGYFGEAVYTTGSGPAVWGLISGIAYFYIVYLIMFGEAKALASKSTPSVQRAHDILTKFVLIGWGIYPLGYMIGTTGWYDFVDGIGLNMDVVYNIGDAINKIGFGLVVYSLAVSKD